MTRPEINQFLIDHPGTRRLIEVRLVKDGTEIQMHLTEEELREFEKNPGANPRVVYPPTATPIPLVDCDLPGGKVVPQITQALCIDLSKAAAGHHTPTP